MAFRGADTSMLQYTDCLLDLAFLTDVTGKLNHLNCEIQGKGKTISDTLSAVNAVQSQDKPFLLLFTEGDIASISIQAVNANNDAFASEVFDRALHKYFELLNRLRQEFEDRFSDFDKLEPSVLFFANGHLYVSEKLRDAFNLDSSEIEMEIPTLNLKTYQRATDFWKLVLLY